MFKRITCTLIAIITLLGITACAKATAKEPNLYTRQVVYVHDWSEPKEPQGMVRIVKEQQEKAAQKEQEAAQADVYEEPEYIDESYYYEAYTPSYSGDGFAQEGVREFNGRTETYYSSNVAYHYRTPEWTVDDEGYYRDDQGRYVVAASDVPEGSEIETSKGTGIVLDGGCEEGVTDFYTAF